MKKINKTIWLFILAPILILSLIFIFCKNTYTITVEQIDNFSPDRKLIVYKNKKKINFKELQYEDGTYLCSGKNPTVSYSEIIGVKKLIVKIDEKKQIVANIVEN